MYDHAVNSGLCAGRNMVASAHGKMSKYEHQPMFHCSLADTGYLLEGVGEIDSSLKTVGVWVARSKTPGGVHDVNASADFPAEPYSRGIVYYIRENRVVGILCCNNTHMSGASTRSAKRTKGNQHCKRFKAQDFAGTRSVAFNHCVRRASK